MGTLDHSSASLGGASSQAGRHGQRRCGLGWSSCPSLAAQQRQASLRRPAAELLGSPLCCCCSSFGAAATARATTTDSSTLQVCGSCCSALSIAHLLATSFYVICVPTCAFALGQRHDGSDKGEHWGVSAPAALRYSRCRQPCLPVRVAIFRPVTSRLAFRWRLL